MKKIKLAVIIGIVFFGGCATQVPLQRFQGDALRTGDSLSAASAKLGQATARLTHNFSWKGKQFEARHYDLQTGSRQEMSMVCSPICIPIFYNVPVLAPYVVVLQGEPLTVVASGLVEELSRSPDPQISEFMPSLKESAEKARAAAKK
jgi:hypothetical protein